MILSKKPANPQNEDRLKTSEKLAAEYNVKSEKPQNDPQQKTAEKLKVGSAKQQSSRGNISTAADGREYR